MNKPIEGTDPMEVPRRRCTAYARSTGQRCGNAPIKGGTVCKFHGGGAPAVRQKAKLRLAALVDPAIATLGRVMVTAERDQDKLRAAEAILDRAGHPRAARIEGRVSLEDAREQLLEQLLQKRAELAAAPVADPVALEVLDAEVLEEGDDR